MVWRFFPWGYLYSKENEASALNGELRGKQPSFEWPNTKQEQKNQRRSLKTLQHSKSSQKLYSTFSSFVKFLKNIQKPTFSTSVWASSLFRTEEITANTAPPQPQMTCSAPNKAGPSKPSLSQTSSCPAASQTPPTTQIVNQPHYQLQIVTIATARKNILVSNAEVSHQSSKLMTFLPTCSTCELLHATFCHVHLPLHLGPISVGD